MEKEICSLLTSLGITSNYYGYYYISQAIQLTASGMENLLLVTKRLYPHIAQIYNTSSKNVERNIRHSVDIAWRTNPALLCELAGHQLKYKPTSGEFLAILSSKIIYSDKNVT